MGKRMQYSEYKEILNYELYRSFHGRKLDFFQKLRIRYFQPNTNCMLMARKMWWLYGKGGIARVFAKLLYLKIIKKYNCIIFPTARIGRGFYITHPTGIVIGNCNVGENFVIYQNCTIGGKTPGDDWPEIGDNVHLGTNSVLLGHIKVASDVYIGASSLVVKDIAQAGVYGGNPLRKLK